MPRDLLVDPYPQTAVSELNPEQSHGAQLKIYIENRKLYSTMFKRFIASVFVSMIPSTQGNSLISTMIDFENVLYTLKSNALAYYRNCEHTCLITSSSTNADNSCAIDACESSFIGHDNSGVETTQKFGYPTVCGNCAEQTSRYLDFKHSAVTNADLTYKTTGLSERQELACWTSQFDTDWVNLQNTGSLTWQYFATPMGLMRTFPGYAQETCTSYDPRVRSWFVAATTGPKDVVVVIDVSGSMMNANRIDLAKEAAKAVVETLTILDRFNVVTFSSGSKALVGSDNLVQATLENKQKAMDAIDELSAEGKTYMELAFEHTFRLFKSSISSEKTTGCHKVVLFLTDGVPSEGKVDAVLEAHISGLNDIGAVIFTYSLGSGAAQELPKNIACQNDGIWTLVEDGTTSLRTQMSYYYDYIASLRDADTNVVWVEPYIDAFGAGEMTTASLAVYDDSTTPNTLLGVLGMDILIADMEALEPNHENFLDKFVSRSSPRCPELKKLSVCAMEHLRSKDYSKLDPEYIDFGRSGGPDYDATCTNEVCPVTTTKVCEGTVRSSSWCTPTRTSFIQETCVKQCVAFTEEPEPDTSSAGNILFNGVMMSILMLIQVLIIIEL